MDETRHDPLSEAGASRRSAVAPFIAMDVKSAANALEAAGRRVLHLEIGEPGARTPERVRDAARAALDEERIGYTEALGWRLLRERIARHYGEHYGVEVPAGRVAITTGSSAGFNLAFLAAFDHGDRVAIASPGYPAYRNILGALGAACRRAADGCPRPPCHHARDAGARPCLGAARRRPRVASPGNPTGTLMAPEALKALIDASGRLGIRFISDEIYHRLVYEGREETALAFSDRAIVINSFSKYYCMTGWRIGWTVLPPELVRPVERIAQSLYISAPDLSQRAALAAFEATEELEVIKAGYAANRRLLLDRLPAMGFDDFFPVDGAFYVYASTRRFTNDSAAFARAMLEEAGVAATPGLDFDRSRGDGHIRFSFAGSEAEVAEAVQRLEGWLKR